MHDKQIINTDNYDFANITSKSIITIQMLTIEIFHGNLTLPKFLIIIGDTINSQITRNNIIIKKAIWISTKNQQNLL